MKKYLCILALFLISCDLEKEKEMPKPEFKPYYNLKAVCAGSSDVEIPEMGRVDTNFIETVLLLDAGDEFFFKYVIEVKDTSSKFYGKKDVVVMQFSKKNCRYNREEIIEK